MQSVSARESLASHLTVLFANPSFFSFSAAASTAAFWPLITICIGELSLATVTTPSDALTSLQVACCCYL